MQRVINNNDLLKHIPRSSSLGRRKKLYYIPGLTVFFNSYYPFFLLQNNIKLNTRYTRYTKIHIIRVLHNSFAY